MPSGSGTHGTDHAVAAEGARQGATIYPAKPLQKGKQEYAIPFGGPFHLNGTDEAAESIDGWTIFFPRMESCTCSNAAVI